MGELLNILFEEYITSSVIQSSSMAIATKEILLFNQNLSAKSFSSK